MRHRVKVSRSSVLPLGPSHFFLVVILPQVRARRIRNSPVVSRRFLAQRALLLSYRRQLGFYDDAAPSSSDGSGDETEEVGGFKARPVQGDDGETQAADGATHGPRVRILSYGDDDDDAGMDQAEEPGEDEGSRTSAVPSKPRLAKPPSVRSKSSPMKINRGSYATPPPPPPPPEAAAIGSSLQVPTIVDQVLACFGAFFERARVRH